LRKSEIFLLDNYKQIQKKARTATLIALAVNTSLGLLKIISGLVISSMSLIADGFDSPMDLFMGIFAFLGTIIAQKPADEDHLYGHEKIEMIYLLLIIGIILLTGLVIFFQALDRFIKGIELEFSILGLVGTILVTSKDPDAIFTLVNPCFLIREPKNIAVQGLQTTSLPFPVCLFRNANIIFPPIKSEQSHLIHQPKPLAIFLPSFLIYPATKQPPLSGGVPAISFK